MTANDGDGRDADASDPGDWCQGSSSSWHGTLVSGIVGALTNNATGIAGTMWHGRILPVRVLGKCGGVDSDIIAAVLWAAGIHVNGVPDNPDPATIINMSLGSTGICPASWQDAISPRSWRAEYSWWSPRATRAGRFLRLQTARALLPSPACDTPAPKWDSAASAPRLRSAHRAAIASTRMEPACIPSTPRRTTAPRRQANNIYTDQMNFNVGTSFSAPIVSGIAALMKASEQPARLCTAHSAAAERCQALPEIAGSGGSGLSRAGWCV